MGHLDADSVAALLGGELTPQMRGEIDDHVDVCDDCRRWVAAAARDHAAHASAVAVTATAEGSTSPRHVMLSVGDRVGRYVVTDFLGAGGMGTVYAAHDPQLDRAVAVKVVRTDSVRAQRLVREAQAMAKLSHEHVVPVYDAGQDGPLVFIAMKRIDGAPLRAYLARQRPRDVLRLMCGAGRGLAAAHAAGIVHRDFKPDNVLVDTDGRAKVADFGLAALPEPGEVADGSPDAFRTDDGAIVGTPAYMAPEVRAGERGDALSDQYSFALTAAEALGDRMPRWVRRALDRALSADPSARFPSMDALLAALERRSFAIPLAAAAAIAVVVWVAWPRGADAGALCDDGARDELARVLGPIQRAELAAHFASLSPAHARGAALALAQLDRRAAEWTAMRGANCRATRATGEQPIAVHDVRAACLDERLDEIAVVRDSLAALDDAHADSAARLASVTSDLAQCTTAHNSAGGGERARALRTRLAQAHVRMQEGFFAEAEPMLDAVLADARAANLPAVEGAVLLSRSTLLAMTRRPGATEGFHQALEIGERIGDGELRVDAQIALLADASIDRSRASEVELLAKMIESGLADLPGPQRLRHARAQANLANYYEDKHDFAAAERASKLAGDAFRDELGPAHPFAIMSLEAQARIFGSENRPDRALELSAQAMDEIERAYGREHPMMVESLLSRGVFLSFAHREGEAATAFHSALQLAEKIYGPDHPRVAAALRKVGFLALDRDPAAARDAFARAIAIETAPPRGERPDVAPLIEGLGEAQLMTGDAKTAVTTLEHCFAVWGDSQVAKHLQPQAKFALARALWESGGDRVRARRLAGDARDEFTANGGPWLPRAGEIEKWLTAHR